MTIYEGSKKKGTRILRKRFTKPKKIKFKHMKRAREKSSHKGA
jgi:hypothetical protein